MSIPAMQQGETENGGDVLESTQTTKEEARLKYVYWKRRTVKTYTEKVQLEIAWRFEPASRILPGRGASQYASEVVIIKKRKKRVY